MYCTTVSQLNKLDQLSSGVEGDYSQYKRPEWAPAADVIITEYKCTMVQFTGHQKVILKSRLDYIPTYTVQMYGHSRLDSFGLCC